MDVVPPEVAAQAQTHVKLVREYIEKNIRPWLAESIVIDAIKAQNDQHAHITISEIDKLDAGFIERTDKKLIDSKLNNPLAAFLHTKKATAAGIIVEIFIVDNKGLNVAQTDMTLDYMQGDEAAWMCLKPTCRSRIRKTTKQSVRSPSASRSIDSATDRRAATATPAPSLQLDIGCLAE
jgi:hypothetical protein